MALEPITRQEQIIAGKDLEPITRMERFLKEYGGGAGGAVSDEQIKNAVENYLDENPIGVDLSIRGATVGQIVKITAVDENGVPTAWEPVDMIGGDVWEHVCDIAFEDEGGTTENADALTSVQQTLAASYKKLVIYIPINRAGGIVYSGGDSFPLRILANGTKNDYVVGMFGTDAVGNGWLTYRLELDYIDYGGEKTFTYGTSYLGGVPGKMWTASTGALTSPIHTLRFDASGGFKAFTAVVLGVRA